MTLICVPIPVHAPEEVPSLLARCARVAECGAGMVEWRIDALFAQPFDSEGEYEAALDCIALLIRDSVLPSLVTARTTTQTNPSTRQLDVYAAAVRQHRIVHPETRTKSAPAP